MTRNPNRNRVAHVGPFPKHKLGQVVGFHWNFLISITSLAFRRQHEGKIAPRRKKSTIEMDPSTSVRRPPLRMAACRFLSACHARWRNQASLPTSAGDASGGCGRAFGASAPADCCAVCCCQRQRAGAIGDWCVAARGRASLARQSWMPCGCSGRPRLGPASASS